MREIIHLASFLFFRCHRAQDAADTFVTLIVKLTMRNFYHYVKEIPDILLRPFKDWRNKNAVLSVNTSYLIVFLEGKFIFIDFLSLALHLPEEFGFTPFNLISPPFCKFFEVS